MKTDSNLRLTLVLLSLMLLQAHAYCLELVVRLNDSSRMTTSILLNGDGTSFIPPEQTSILEGILTFDLFEATRTEKVELRQFQFKASQPLNFALTPLQISLASSNISVFQKPRPDNQFPTWTGALPPLFSDVHFSLGGEVHFEGQAEGCDLLRLLKLGCAGKFDLSQREVPALDTMPFSVTISDTALQFTGTMEFADVPLVPQIPSLATLSGNIVLAGEAEIPPFLLIEPSEDPDRLRVARLTAFGTSKIQATADLVHSDWRTLAEPESSDDRWVWIDVPIGATRFFRLIP